MPLQPGDVLLMYTDGVTEAIDGTGQLFSDARLLESLAAGRGRPVVEIVENLMNAVNAFAAGQPQEDDITVLALRYQGHA